MAQTKIKAGLFEGIIGNGTDGYFLMSNGDGTMTWSSIVINPTITSIAYPGSVTAADPAGGETITVTGTGFKTGATVTVGGTSAPAVSYVSATQITFTTPAKAAGDYDIVVTNTDTGSATYINGISYNGVPTWTTAAGSLGTFASNTTISTITLQATEPDAGTITFNITNGALPTGLSLTGANIDGTTSLETADTLYTFTVTATDDESQATPRTFTITVQKQFISTDNFTINTYTGNGSTQAIEGKIGTAAEFNGSSSYINAPIDIIASAGDYSVSGWVKSNSNSNSNNIYPLFWMWSGTTYKAAWVDARTTNLALYVSHKDTSNEIQSYSFTHDTNWHHYAVSYDYSAQTVSLYVDGAAVKTNVALSNKPNIGNDNFIGGRWDYNSTAYYSSHASDQLRFFNKALSSSEVTTLYGESNTSTTKSTTDIFDDGSGVALYEFEKGAIDTGGTNGYIGSAGVFDGSSSYIETPSLIPVNDYSFSCWVYFDSLAAASNYRVIYEAYKNTWWYLSIFDGGKIATYNGTSTFNTTSNVISAGQWYHIVYTSSSTAGKNIYLNGNSTPVATTGDTTGNSNPSGSWEGFGKYHTTGVGSMHGRIDQTRIFNRAITTSEIATLYGETSASATKSTTDIFNDGSGVALYELEGNANDSSGNTLPLDIDNIDFANKKVFDPTDMDAYTSPGCAFGDNGNRLYAGDEYLDGTIREYALSTPYDISTAASTATGSKNLDESYMYGFKIVSSTRIFATENNSVIEYQMSTPWSISTATSTLNKFTKANMGSTLSNSSFTAWDFNSDGTKLIASYQNNAGTQAAFEIFNLSTAYTITGVDSATPASSSGWINVSYDGHRGLYWSENEDQVFYIGLTGIAHQFGFATAGDASTITLTKTRSMGYGNLGGFEWYPDQNILLTASETNQNYVQASWSQGDYNGTATNVSYAYDGTPTNVSFVGTSFQPDLVWIKNRSITPDHVLFDSIRGAEYYIRSNTTDSQNASADATTLNSFDSNGFTISGATNTGSNGHNFVAWAWKAASSNSTNTDGSITSTVRANQAAGFSIVKVLDKTNTVESIGHGLSQAPELIITKLTETTQIWLCYHKDAGTNGYLSLNGTGAFTSLTGMFSAVNSTTFTTNTAAGTSDMIAYCFHSVDGYQKIGSYLGTGSSNTITTGFKPRFVMIKATNNASDWYMIDAVRPNNKFLIANGNGSEYTASDTHTFTSTGFTLSGSSYNNSGYNWIYLAIA